VVLGLCQTFNLTHAQRYLPGQKGIQLTGGMADGFKKPGKAESDGLATFGCIKLTPK